jgi:hypothetical protein
MISTKTCRMLHTDESPNAKAISSTKRVTELSSKEMARHILHLGGN